jgi:cupin fold WbuC family metalloprotein
MKDIPRSKATFNQDWLISIGKNEIQDLKKSSVAPTSVRICLHDSPEAALHEMLIVHQKDAYVKPHKHLNKSESFHVIEGEMDVFIFDGAGKVIQKIQMGDYNSGKSFCYRLSTSEYHTVLPKTKYVVFHEVTNGPFRRDDTIFGEWAPGEGEGKAVNSFIMSLKQFTPDSN